MKEQLPELIEDSIQLELHIAELYKVFSAAYPEDSAFWQELCWEERHHAHLIETMKKALLPGDEFPEEVLAPSLKRLSKANNKIKSLIKKYTDAPPPRKYAFSVAISTEKAAGEIHYQHAMDVPSNSKYVKLWQTLNEGDKDHVERITSYKSLTKA